MTFRRKLLLLAATASLGLAAPIGSALAQAYPSKPVTIIVSYPAGGDTDVIARAFAERLTTRFGQQ